MFDELAKSIDDKLWFVGEHTHSDSNYYVHGAYQTGERAAKEAISVFEDEAKEEKSQ